MADNFPANWTYAAAAGGNMKDYMVNVVMPNTQPLWDNGYADKISNEDWDDAANGWGWLSRRRIVLPI